MLKYFVSLLIVVVFASCGNDSNEVTTDLVNIPATADGEVDEGSLPKFEFKRTTFDFGAITPGEIVSHTFKFKNVGGSDLIIAKVATSWGCTVSEYTDKPIKPGEEGLIEIVFDSSGRTGMQHKTLTVIANTQPNKMELNFTAEIISK